jgi:hypothetical protein
MLLRSRFGRTYATPLDFPFAAVEPIRERMMCHPLLYVSKPLAVFAKTRETARAESRAEWAIAQTALAATFVKYAEFADPHRVELFAYARAQRPPATNVLLLAAMMDPACRSLLPHTKISDWLLLLRGIIRRPNVFWRVVCSKWRHEDWWHLLDQHTAARFNELRLQRADDTKSV